MSLSSKIASQFLQMYSFFAFGFISDCFNENLLVFTIRGLICLTKATKLWNMNWIFFWLVPVVKKKKKKG